MISHMIILSDRLVTIVLDALKEEYEATFNAAVQEAYDAIAGQAGGVSLRIREDEEIHQQIERYKQSRR